MKSVRTGVESGDDSHEAAWQALAGAFLAGEEGVGRGRMMSADALTYGGKVFAFYAAKGPFPGVGVRLGREVDVFSLKLAEWEYFSPFKSKPPMMDWVLIGGKDRARWPDMARFALDLMRSAARLEAARKVGKR